MYVHFFDVNNQWQGTNGEYVVPEATIQFNNSMPSGVR